jgi:hypothetical protein
MRANAAQPCGFARAHPKHHVIRARGNDVVEGWAALANCRENPTGRLLRRLLLRPLLCRRRVLVGGDEAA